MSIQVGDRVSWQDRESRWFGAIFLPERILTGTVRAVMRSATTDGVDDYAYVVTADGQLRMPSVTKLTKLEQDGPP